MESRVLLVDDNPSDRLIVRALVERSGLLTTEAGDAYEAIDALEDEEVTFNLLVIDLQMPKLPGLELVKRLRRMERHRKTPVLIMSARNRPVDVQLAINSGANDYVIKPVDLQIMEQKIQRLTKGSSDNWKMYDLNEESRHTEAAFLASTLSLNEVSANVSLPVDLPVDYSLTLNLDLLRSRGLPGIISKIESKAKDAKTGAFLYKVNFVGLTDTERKQIRLACRDMYIKDKAQD